MGIHIVDRDYMTGRSLPPLTGLYFLGGKYPATGNHLSVMQLHAKPIIKSNKAW